MYEIPEVREQRDRSYAAKRTLKATVIAEQRDEFVRLGTTHLIPSRTIRERLDAKESNYFEIVQHLLTKMEEQPFTEEESYNDVTSYHRKGLPKAFFIFVRSSNIGDNFELIFGFG